MKKIYLYFILLTLPAIIGILLFDIAKYKPKKIRFEYNENGDMMASSPFPPSLRAIFGVDRNSNNMLFEILSGYRITFIIIIFVAFIVLIIAIIVGSYFSIKKRDTDIFDIFLNAFFFIPQSIIAYIVLQPIIYEPFEGFKTSILYRSLYYLIVLVILMIPTTVGLIKNSTDLLLDKEFIRCSETMSPYRLYRYRKHIFPNMIFQYLIIFMRILFQVLIVVAHLSFFKLYFGGTDVCYGPACIIIEQPLVPELSSLLGHHFNDISNAWWTFLFPLLSILYMLILIKLISIEFEGKEEVY
ncbi:TPA: hypothetical protein P6W17_002316 [Staphylococcus aureus]|nr:hypothetical protein [Staphylococcus aureus]HDP5870765.1 hypothetical protein [Staphylococcus aureus]HDP5926211.1 hypothetical protein [Staphylococcus aureus]HDP6029071.1 hypothetical protein [Staphylococcus aureus]HDP6109931.1 hypothetical protein [Staphylococcus aureus]